MDSNSTPQMPAIPSRAIYKPVPRDAEISNSYTASSDSVREQKKKFLLFIQRPINQVDQPASTKPYWIVESASAPHNTTAWFTRWSVRPVGEVRGPSCREMQKGVLLGWASPVS
jgi:hypothetical protein